MGLAASQCRLLLLTARLSDTEYRAQMISQRRINLALQTEQIAMNYTRAMGNKILKHVFDYDGNKNTRFVEDLTYATLTAEDTGVQNTKFRVLDVNGRIAVPSAEAIPGVIVTTDDKGNTMYNQVTKAQIKEFALKALASYPEIKDIASENWTDADYQAAWALIQKDHKEAFAKAYGSASTAKPVESGTVILGADNKEYVVLPALNNKDFFQNAIRTGAVQVQKYSREYTENEGWSNYDIMSSPLFDEMYYTEDDAAAQAEYETKSAMIQAQDKMLEVELKQVETQHQAAQTEYESVKKVIDKNIERSFKTFG